MVLAEFAEKSMCRMLYEFHKSQNARKPGSLHATYVVYGTKQDSPLSQTAAKGDEDVEMSSSMPEIESIPEHVPTATLSLVPEAQLKGMAASLRFKC